MVAPDAAAKEILVSKGAGIPFHMNTSSPGRKSNCGTWPGFATVFVTGTTVRVAGVIRADNGSVLGESSAISRLIPVRAVNR